MLGYAVGEGQGCGLFTGGRDLGHGSELGLTFCCQIPLLEQEAAHNLLDLYVP